MGAGPNFTCSLGTIANGGSASRTISYTVPATTEAGSATNTASVASTTNDPVSANNSASDTNTVLEDVRLSIDKEFGSDFTADADEVVAGSSGNSLKIKVTNDGASEADAVTIVDDLPAGLHATAVSSTAGTCTLVDSPADLDVLVDDVSCTLANLASGASVTVTVTYSADADLEGGTVKTNTASADADDTDNTTHPVTDSDTVSVREVVDLDVVKDFSGDEPGDRDRRLDRQHLLHHGHEQRPVQR